MPVPLPNTVENRGALSRDRDRTLSELNRAAPSSVADRVEHHLDERIRGGFFDGPSRAPRNLAEHFSRMMSGAGNGWQYSIGESQDLGRSLLSVAANQSSDPQETAAFAEQTWGRESSVYQAFAAGGAVSGASVDSGGAVVAASVRDEYIDLLRPRVAVMALDPVMVPMPTGSMVIHEVTADASASYVGEDDIAQVSRPSMGGRKMTAKTLKTNIPIKKDHIRRARTGAPGSLRDVERFIQRTALRRSAIKKDMTYLRARGTDNTPKGIRYWAAEKNIYTAAATNDFISVLQTLGGAIGRMEDADVLMTRPGWILRPRDKNFLAYQCLSDDRPFFLEMISRGELLNGPFATSSLVPGNLGVNGDASEIYLADFELVLIGDTLELEMETVHNGTYYENGKLVSAGARDEVLVVMREQHDLTVEHREAVVVLTEVRWAVAA